MKSTHPCPTCGYRREARPESHCRECRGRFGKRDQGFGPIEIDDTVRGLIREAVDQLKGRAA